MKSNYSKNTCKLGKDSLSSSNMAILCNRNINNNSSKDLSNRDNNNNKCNRIGSNNNKDKDSSSNNTRMTIMMMSIMEKRNITRIMAEITEVAINNKGDRIRIFRRELITDNSRKRNLDLVAF